MSAIALSSARHIDVGLLDPALFHATYAAIALARNADARPVVVWGRAGPHISIGPSQDAAVELDPDIAVPVVRRPLGGGAVWIDEWQHCYVLVAPLARAPRRPAEWFEWGLRPAIATYRRFGLRVERVEQDLWLAGRKIAGSGAATLGACAVFASSFLIRFPVHRFAGCVRAPSSAYRAWLAAGLASTMTDWESHQQPPGAPALGCAFRAALQEQLGWKLSRSALGDSERISRNAALKDMTAEDWTAGGKAVPGGIRLNARSFLAETQCAGGMMRTLNVGGITVRQEFVPANRP